MTICHRGALLALVIVGFFGVESGCGYRLGQPSSSVAGVSYYFGSDAILPPDVESELRQAVWMEVRRRVDTGEGCRLQITIVEANDTPSLGGLSLVDLSISGQLGEGEVLMLNGHRNFSANTPQVADELRRISYGELASSLVSEILLRLLTDGDNQCH